MGQSCCGTMPDERKQDSARLKEETATDINFARIETEQRESVPLSRGAPELATQIPAAMKEIDGDGNEKEGQYSARGPGVNEHEFMTTVAPSNEPEVEP